MKDRTLSELKAEAHQCFDIFWKSKYENRSKSYAWMMGRMGKGHIADLTIKECVIFISMCDERKYSLGLRFSIQREKQPWMEKRIKGRRKMALVLADRFCDMEELFSK